MSDEAAALLREQGIAVSEWGYPPEEIERHDPRLVAVVEKLGVRANGMVADLQIEMIEGDRYRIDEYDGLEIVVTPMDVVEWIVIK